MQHHRAKENLLKHRGTEAAEVENFIFENIIDVWACATSIFLCLLLSSVFQGVCCWLNLPSPAWPPSPASSQYAARCVGPESDVDRRHGYATMHRLSAGSAERETSLSLARVSRRKSPCSPAACHRRTIVRRQVDGNMPYFRSAPRRTSRRHADLATGR
jgi:hypothetical protein